MNALYLSEKTLKQIARRLRAHLSASNQLVSHTQSLEAAAACYGFKNWQTALAACKELEEFHDNPSAIIKHEEQVIVEHFSNLLPLIQAKFSKLQAHFNKPTTKIEFEVEPADGDSPLYISYNALMDIEPGTRMKLDFYVGVQVRGSAMTINPVFLCESYEVEGVNVSHLGAGVFDEHFPEKSVGVNHPNLESRLKELVDFDLEVAISCLDGWFALKDEYEEERLNESAKRFFV